MDTNRKKIMLVDDDRSIRQQGKALLKDIYEVYPLPSAHKLFEVLTMITPDLILLDIKMPEIDGFETIKQLKSNERYSHIPVIFLTASNDKESVLKGSSLGAASFVTKPFSANDLSERIEKCIIAAKPVILAVDDAPDILKAIHTILRDRYKVYTLSKPEKLQDLLGEIKPELFLLDYKMPELSGFDLMPVIRAFPEHKETPVIFLTSEGTIDHLTVAVSLGACDFIVKPFNVDILREKIAKHTVKKLL